MLWIYVILLIAGVIFTACIGSKEVYSLLYRLFCLFRMLVIMPLFIIGVMLAGYHYNIIKNKFADGIYLLAGIIIYFTIVFSIDILIEWIAKKHGINL